MQKFEKQKILTKKIFKLNFYQDQKKWRQKPIPIEISKKESDRVTDLLIYKNQYALIKKSNVF